MPEFDSTSLNDYLEWESDVEQCIYEFPHSSRQVGAIIEKKLTGYIGACWRIHEMGRKRDVSWKYIKRALRKFIVADYHEPSLDVFVKEDAVLVDDSHIPIVEELEDEVRDPYVLEVEVENHDIGRVNEIAGEMELKEEYHEAKFVEEEGIELYGIEFEHPEVEQVMDLAERAVEPHELNDHQWIFKDEIDRIHDEWYERVRRFLIVFMGYDARHVIALGVDAEKLWELLIQRGFAECDELHEPSDAGHIYLTLFQFCRFIFDPGGNLFRFEDESFQEGENDMIRARSNLKSWQFKLKIQGINISQLGRHQYMKIKAWSKR